MRTLMHRMHPPGSCPARGSTHRRRAVALAAAALTLLAATSPAAAGSAAPRDETAAPAALTRAGSRAQSPWALPAPGGIVRPADIPRTPWAAGHRGLDLGVRPGATITAPAAGVVGFVGQVAGRGIVVIEHPGGLRSTLEPVSPLAPTGSDVTAGQPVATLSAEPGHCAPQSCLHWGVRLGEAYIDPAALLARPRIVLMPASS